MITARIPPSRSGKQKRTASSEAVLLVSFELDEVMSLSDRIDVIFDGKIVSSIPGKDANENELGLMMAGGGNKQ